MVTGSREVVEQIKHQVEKLVDVINVAEMRQDASIQKELVLIKIATTEVTRTHIIELAEIFKAKVEDVASTAITLQITGSLDKIASFIDLAKEYGIVELVRTGITALGRGASSQMELGVVDE